MDTQAMDFEHRPHKGNGGAFAIGARNMECGGQTVMRIAQRDQQTLHPFKLEINQAGMKLCKAVDELGSRHGHGT
jgi:hypothetical protein